MSQDRAIRIKKRQPQLTHGAQGRKVRVVGIEVNHTFRDMSQSAVFNHRFARRTRDVVHVFIDVLVTDIPGRLCPQQHQPGPQPLATTADDVVRELIDQRDIGIVELDTEEGSDR